MKRKRNQGTYKCIFIIMSAAIISLIIYFGINYETTNYSQMDMHELKGLWNKHVDERAKIASSLVEDNRINKMSRVEIREFFGEPYKIEESRDLYGFVSNKIDTYTYIVMVEYSPKGSVQMIRSYIINTDAISGSN